MNDKLKFYAGTIAFMLSVITIIGCIACFFSTPAYAAPVKTADDSDIEYVTPLEVHLRELNAQPPFAPVLPVPEPETTETEPESEPETTEMEPESEPSVETAETAVEPAEEPVTNTIPQNLSDNEYAIYTALRDVGLSKAGTAAVMGCMTMESGLNASAENPSDGGYGLLQWTHGRKTNLLNWCYASGLDASSVSGQVQFFVHELNATYSQAAGYSYPVYETLTTSDSVEDCLAMFFSHMEAGVNVPISSSKVYCGNLTTLQLYNKRLNAAYKYF